MAENTRTCLPCCNPPVVAVNASEVISDARNLTQYVYVSTIQSQVPNYKYQYKSQTERIQTLIGKLANPQAVAMRSNGGQPC
jgi:hypothetical protein